MFPARPETVLLEFLAWFVWLAGFALLQNRLCLGFPGIRSVCRKAYMFTMALPILAGIWFMTHSGKGADLFAVLNRAFGAGVFAQTFLRCLVLLKWLVLSGIPHQVAAPAHPAAAALRAETGMVALVGLLGRTLRKPAASEHSAEAPRDSK